MLCAACSTASFGSAVGDANLWACAQSASGSAVGTAKLPFCLRRFGCRRPAVSYGTGTLCPIDSVHPSHVMVLVQDLADKIAQLNSAIDEVSSRLKPEDRVANESIVDATS